MQKRFSFFVLLVLAFTVVAEADIKPMADEPVGRILEMKRRAGLIRADVALFRELLWRDVRYTHSTGLVQSKDDVIKMLSGNSVNYLSIDVEEENYAILSKSIIVTGTQKIRLKVGGKVVTSRSRFTVVYQIIREDWKCIAYQSTPCPEEND